LRETLDAYQSLYAGAKPDPGRLQPAALRALRLSDADGAALLGHLRAGLEQGAPEMRHPQDEAIIRDARQKLAGAKTS
jgi:hypothetical protein